MIEVNIVFCSKKGEYESFTTFLPCKPCAGDVISTENFDDESHAAYDVCELTVKRVGFNPPLDKIDVFCDVTN